MLCLKAVHGKVGETAVPQYITTLGSKSNTTVYKAGDIRKGATVLPRLVSEVKAVARRC
jgi:hypothetical protein